MRKTGQYTSSQIEAIQHTLDLNSHQKIIAGPGSGKTTTLLARVLHLIESGVEPSKILILAFNRSIKNEFIRKLTRTLADHNYQELPDVRTINSWGNSLCYEFMRVQPSSGMFISGPPNTQDDLSKLMKGVFAGGGYKNKGVKIFRDGKETELKAQELFVQFPELDRVVYEIKSPKTTNPDLLRASFANKKQEHEALMSLEPPLDSHRFIEAACQIMFGYRGLLGTIDDYHDRRPADIDLATWQLLFATVKEIDRYLRKQGVVFYPDQTYKAATALARSKVLREYLQEKYRYMIVDEYQDVSEVSHFMITVACEKNCQLNAVGDPRQAIFEFAGSDPQFLISGIDERLGNVATRFLNESFRFGRSIAKLANTIGWPLIETLLPNQEDNWDYMFDDYIPEKLGGEIIGCGPQGIVKRVSNSKDLSLYLESQLNNGISPILIVRAHSQKVTAEKFLMESKLPFQLDTQTTDAAMSFVISSLEFVVQCWVSERIVFADQPSFWKHYIGPSMNPAGRPEPDDEDWVKFKKYFQCLLVTEKLKAVMPSELQYSIYKQHMELLAKDFIQLLKTFQDEKEYSRELAASHFSKDIATSLNAKAFFNGSIQEDKPRVQVEVAHAIKGLEFESVVLFECIENFMPFVRPGSPADSDGFAFILEDKKHLESERRLAFVAATRAKRDLVIFVPPGTKESRYTRP